MEKQSKSPFDIPFEKKHTDNHLKFRLFLKRIRDRKLKTKVRVSMFILAFLSILGIGFYSYYIARNTLITNTRQSVRSMLKQNSRALEDRISVFEESSYRILQTSPLVGLFDLTPEEAAAQKTRNEGMPAAIASESSLSEYTEYALLEPSSGVIYDYYYDTVHHLDDEEERKLMEHLKPCVSKVHPTAWKSVDGENYFIRRVVNNRLEEQGTVIFCIKSDFFDIVSDDIHYMTNDNVIIQNEDGDILKNPDQETTTAVLNQIKKYQEDGSRYIYSLTRELNHETCLITVIHMDHSKWSMTSWFSYQVLLQGINRIFLAILEVMLIIGALIMLVTMRLSRAITRNVTVIENGMKEYEQGNFSYRMHPATYDEIGLISLQMNHMALEISDLMDKLQLREEEKRKLEVATLQAQINPHFLYNTLGSIKWAAYRNGQKDLADSLDALVSLLRFTIKRAGGMVALSEEIDYIKNYIVIEKTRYGDQFEIEYDIEDDVRDQQVPGFILQPMVENSLLHGLDMTKNDGMIFISADMRGGRNGKKYLVISEEDNGAGMDQETASRLLSGPDEPKYTGFSSIGMKIVDRRMKEIYGAEYHTDIHTAPGEGTRIELWIPKEVEM